MALLLGRRGRPRRLVRPARSALAATRPGGQGARPRARRGRLPARPRPPPDRRAAALRRALRARLGGRARRGHATRSATSPRPGSTSIFWLGLPALSVVFGNVWRALSPWRAMADAFVWVRERTGARGRPLAAYPEGFGPLAGRARDLRLRHARARVLRSCEPACARVRDRALHVRRAVRDGGVRARDLGADRRGLRRPLRPARARRAASRGGRADPGARGPSPGWRAPSGCRDRSPSSR